MTKDILLEWKKNTKILRFEECDNVKTNIEKERHFLSQINEEKKINIYVYVHIYTYIYKKQKDIELKRNKKIYCVS